MAPDKSWINVVGIRIDLMDHAVEGAYPTPRADWPVAAHGPSVLAFQPGPVFKTMTPEDQRAEFAGMAMKLTALGKGARVTDNGATTVHRDRSIAYADAVCMGESATIRRGMLADSLNGSSCGMFMRSLYKMIGVQDASYAAEYVWSTVIANEIRIAKSVGALVTPGAEEQVPDPDNPGATIPQLKMPKVGDAVIIQAPQHVQIITKITREEVVRRTDRKGITRQYPNNYYEVAQGGQILVPNRFPDDGYNGTATNQGTVHIDSQNWKVGKRTVNPGWIDLNILAQNACDDDASVIPVRVAMW